MLKVVIAFILSLVVFFMTSYFYQKDREIAQRIESLSFNVDKLDESLIKKHQQLLDLTLIVEALNKYKHKYKHYPIQAWSTFINPDGTHNIHWINNLAPEFLKELPRDPRKSDDPSLQYIYVSNGAHYKLAVSYPENCNEVVTMYPSLMIPYGEGHCIGYGFWSSALAAYMF